jgi:hypothetical protein
VHRREWKPVRQEPHREGEVNDVAHQNPTIVADLMRSLADWRKLHPAGGVREADRPAADFKIPKLWAVAAA